mmetsp:Transcript_42111/g.69395  ORF Transcript_42111/g.69395 Transcript_42111/m.69395 type:complete len:280 (-) Transcript_42111:117-956(-)
MIIVIRVGILQSQQFLLQRFNLVKDFRLFFDKVFKLKFTCTIFGCFMTQIFLVLVYIIINLLLLLFLFIPIIIIIDHSAPFPILSMRIFSSRALQALSAPFLAIQTALLFVAFSLLLTTALKPTHPFTLEFTLQFIRAITCAAVYKISNTMLHNLQEIQRIKLVADKHIINRTDSAPLFVRNLRRLPIGFWLTVHRLRTRHVRFESRHYRRMFTVKVKLFLVLFRARIAEFIQIIRQASSQLVAAILENVVRVQRDIDFRTFASMTTTTTSCIFIRVTR